MDNQQFPVSTLPAPLARAETPPVPEIKDNFREIIETVVFVVVLVLLLKSFVAEAFVIPTGSMAETLWGYQKLVDCPKCKHHFPVNCSSEVDPPDEDRRAPVTGCTCPNCRYAFYFRNEKMDPSPTTGDRVLVSKYVYDTVMKPERFDVVVFKYPVDPQKKHVPMNYIKRLVGQPGETIAIYSGDLYNTRDLKYLGRPQAEVEDQRRTLTYDDDAQAQALFRQQIENQFAEPIDHMKFEIIRKDPDKILAMRRLVNDNEHQPTDQIGVTLPRWWPRDEANWNLDNREQPRRFTHAAQGGALEWLVYRHIVRDSGQPELINDFMGYNSAISGPHSLPRGNWVGDLILECELKVAQPKGRFVLDLSKGVDRFQARWDLATGSCSLIRLADGRETTLTSRPTELRKPGTYRLRFANVDERLVVWVDSALPFGDGVAYPPPRERGPTERDLEPAHIGSDGPGITVEGLKLWRDTYYTVAAHGSPSEADADSGERWDFKSPAWHDPLSWEPLHNLPVRTMYVQPHHFLCLGDNSPESSDGRSWGLVPRRLLLGRALLVYYPLSRAGPIR
jgi:signal peptidase I